MVVLLLVSGPVATVKEQTIVVVVVVVVLALDLAAPVVMRVVQYRLNR